VHVRRRHWIRPCEGGKFGVQPTILVLYVIPPHYITMVFSVLESNTMHPASASVEAWESISWPRMRGLQGGPEEFAGTSWTSVPSKQVRVVGTCRWLERQL